MGGGGGGGGGRVLIAPDKFKGSLTAAQAAAALAVGWREGWPVDNPLEIERLPVADGGKRTAEASATLWLVAG